MNSDVTVFFLDVLPRLKPGVLVGVHDFWLPEDYPPYWDSKYYNEQYLLGCWLLGGGSGIELILPAWYACHDPQLSSILAPLYTRGSLAGTEPHGCAVWFRVTDPTDI